MTGDDKADFSSMQQWFRAFYNNGQETGLMNPAVQYDPGEFDPDNLRDPVDATLAHAQLTANEAYEQGRGVGDTANAAQTAAEAAQTTADTAVTNAAAAQSTANTAVTNAATAQTTANTAVTNAATAQTTANTAVTNAATAQSTATSAASAAATAQADATSALAKVPIHTNTMGAAGAGTSFSDAFSMTLANTNWFPFFSVRSFTGSPPADAFIITSYTKSTTNIGITVAAAPGVGNLITFDYILIPLAP